MSNLAEVNEVSFEKDVFEANTPVLVDFFAPWCGPCKMLAPMLDKLAGEYAGRVKMVKVNVDDAPKLASTYEITGVPTLILFKGRAVVDKMVGVPSQRDLKVKLDKVAPPPAAQS